MPSLGVGRLAKSIPGTGSGMKLLLGSPVGDLNEAAGAADATRGLSQEG
jgi:hypothetical protein